MAKRYFQFSFLSSLNGEFKPANTLGKHHCTVVPQGDIVVVVGSRDGKVTVKDGDTLGYDCGSVWIVPKPESYKDPIRRAMAESRYPQRLLEYVDDGAELVVFKAKLSSVVEEAAYPGAYAISHTPVHGAHEQLFCSSKPTLRLHKEGWDYYHTEWIVGPEVLAIYTFSSTDFGKLVVRKGADKEAIASWFRDQRNNTRTLGENMAREAMEKRHDCEVR